MDFPETPSDHPQLDALIAGYLHAIERGEQPSRSELIAANPDLAVELLAFFAELDRDPRASQRAAGVSQPSPPNANTPPDPVYASTVIRSHAEPQPGVIIAGRYKLLENIGEGGMGSVWVADQQRPVKRRVAIKLIKAGMDSKQVLARFEAERQALAVMDHPNIAKVFDGGLTEQGRPYFVMEYVKGVPFTDYCDRARLPLKDRLSLFVQVCSAVQHAHQKGIIHRDLKPSNILICLYDGHAVPKVIDFGLAKAMHQPLTEQTIYTGHGVMVGTPLYMSPEQAELNNLDIDTRTDIYSLGVVLYELLTGSTPLERNQLQRAAFEEMLRLIKEVEPPRPSLRLSGSDSLPSIAAQRSIDPKHLSRSLAGDLDWIVMKTLDKERSRRYETANGLARDIDRFLNEEPVEACPPSTAYRIKKYVKRHRGATIAVGIVVLMLLLGIAGTSWGLFLAKKANEQTTTALDEVTKARDAKEVERKKAEAAAELLEQRKAELEIANDKSTALLAEAAQSDRVTAEDLWDHGQELDALAYSARALDYQPLSVAGLDSLVSRVNSRAWPQSIATLTGHEEFVYGAEFSPDGMRIVTASYDKTARIWDASTGVSLATLTGHEEFVWSAEFSPDGMRIVTASEDKTARIWDASTGALLATLTGHEEFVKSAEFSPDGTRIVTASADKTARIWDASTGASLATLTGHEDIVRSAEFSPDGMRIVTASNDYTARIWDASTGVSLATLTGHEEFVWSAEFSPDGTRIVTALYDTARIWDASTGASLTTLTGHEYCVNSAEFSPDGMRIVTASYDKTARIWDASTGALLATLTGHEDVVLSAEFSPDGMRIVTASEDKTARIWDASTGALLATLTGHEDVVWSVEFSPDGTRIVTALYDTARIWDASTGALLATLTGHEDVVLSAEFSPDGMRIVTASYDKTARIWDVASDTVPPPVWFKTCLRFLGRRAHGSNGEVNIWPTLADESQVATELRQAIKADKTRYGDIARFLLTPCPEKPTYPGSKVTCGEGADRLIRPAAHKSEIERAYNWHSTHPLVQIALARFEENTTRSEFLREYGVSRLLKRLPTADEPADRIAGFCRRAGDLLIEQGDHSRAALVLDKATTLAPQHPDLPQLRVRLEQLQTSLEPTEPPPPPESQSIK